MTKLNSCPFCGADEPQLQDVHQVEADSWICSIVCLECCAEVRYGYGAPSPENALKDACETWNRRSPNPGPGSAKPSDCCDGEYLVPLHSTDTKICTGCKTERNWPLEEGQRRTMTNNRADRGKECK